MNNNYNSKTYKHGGRKKDFNQDFNKDNDNKKKNIQNNNKLNDNNRLRNREQISTNNESNKKNKKKPIFIIKIKKGKNIIIKEINSNFNIDNEIMKKLKEELSLGPKEIYLLQEKIKKAYEITNTIFEEPMNENSYKQMTTINNIILNESKKRNNIPSILRRIKSVKDNEFKKEKLNKDIEATLSGIQKNKKLSKSS